MKVVLDTNVLVSALLNRNGTPGRILQAIWDGNLELLISAPLHDELVSVLEYPKIRKRLVGTGVDVRVFLELLPFFVTTVTLKDVAVPRPRNENDWIVLATMVAGQADWLVTGDADLLALNDRLPILTPTAFRERFLA